jgi:hypothetical protein
MNNVVKTIEAANYRPTEEQVEQLAFTVTLGMNSAAPICACWLRRSWTPT